MADWGTKTEADALAAQVAQQSDSDDSGDEWDADSTDDEAVAKAEAKKKADKAKKAAAAEAKAKAEAEAAEAAQKPKAFIAQGLAPGEDLLQAGGGAADAPVERNFAPVSLDRFELESMDDYKHLAQVVGEKVAMKQKSSKKIVAFLEIVLQTTLGPLRKDHVDQVRAVATRIYNEKNKADLAKKKKGKGGTKNKHSIQQAKPDSRAFEDEFDFL